MATRALEFHFRWAHATLNWHLFKTPLVNTMAQRVHNTLATNMVTFDCAKSASWYESFYIDHYL